MGGAGQDPGLFHRGNGASGPVMGVFQAEKGGGGQVEVFSTPGFTHSPWRQNTPWGGNGARDYPSNGRDTPYLVIVNVGLGFN